MAWYNESEDKTEMTRMLNPYENIAIGSNPTKGMKLETVEKFKAFVNLTGTPEYPLPKGIVSYWIPVSEQNFWGFHPFLEANKILDCHHERGEGIYLHCEYGGNRSPCIAVGWLLSRGHNLNEAARISAGENEKLIGLNLSQFERNLSNGFIPGNIVGFLASRRRKAS